MRKKKIWHNDVKLNNFLINEENLVRIIDFDVSSSALMDLTDSNGMIPNMKGCSSGYASPEAINFWKNQLMKLPPVGKMNPWKSDIYSWGMMALFLLKVVEISGDKANDLDQKKINEESNKWILSKIDKINIIEDNKLAQNLKCILRFCLKFKPEERIKFADLSKAMEKISIINNKELEAQLNDDVKRKIKSRKSLNEEIETLKKRIKNSRQFLNEEINYDPSIKNLPIYQVK